MNNYPTMDARHRRLATSLHTLKVHRAEQAPPASPSPDDVPKLRNLVRAKAQGARERRPVRVLIPFAEEEVTA